MSRSYTVDLDKVLAGEESYLPARRQNVTQRTKELFLVRGDAGVLEDLCRKPLEI